MPEGVIAIGAIRCLWALFWGKIPLASINETKWPGILAIVLFIVSVQTKNIIWLPLSIQPALCAVLFMLAGQKAREAGLFDKGALPPALWICALMTWLYCSALYGQLYMVSNTYQHGAIDVIGGICGAAVDQAKWARFRAAARRHAPPSPGSGGTRLRYSAYTSSCSMPPRGVCSSLGAMSMR